MTISRMNELLEYANDKQKEYLNAAIACNGRWTKAGVLLGISESTIRLSIKRLDYTVSKAGFDPEGSLQHKAPAGFSIDRVSSFIDDEGKVQRQWVIANRDKEDQFNTMREAWEEACISLPRATLVPAPKCTMEKLLVDYTIGDAHIGMYAWAEEAGEEWDTAKGVDIMRKAMNHLVYHAPAAETAYILDVGDYFHTDNSSNRTERSGAALDVDTRWGKVLKIGIQAAIDLVDMALAKHKLVYFRAAHGNHNDHSSVMLSIALEMRYADEPRVVVLGTQNMFNYFQFGVNLLADTHGHTTKSEKLPLIMAIDQPKMWAETTNRIWRTGHVHHLTEKEYGGCSVLTYRTLAPKDSWHAASGYRSNRDMRATIYHYDKGTVGINIVNPSMLGYA
jgi:hypothetical protein